MNPNVLFVDDAASRINRFRQETVGQRCRSEFAKNTSEAIALLMHEPDIVFLDHDFKDERDWDCGMRVVEFIVAGRRNNKVNFNPVVIIHSENEDAQIAMEATLRAADIEVVIRPYFDLKDGEELRLIENHAPRVATFGGGILGI